MSWRPLSGGILGKNVRASEGQRVVFTLLYLPTSSKFHVYVEAQYIRHMKMKFFMDIGAGPHLDAILPPRPLPTDLHCWQHYGRLLGVSRNGLQSKRREHVKILFFEKLPRC